MTGPVGFPRQLLAIAALFSLLGFQYSTWASRIPALADRMDLDPREVGLLLLATGVGAAGSFPLVRYLMRRLGSRDLACLSGLLLGGVLIALSATPSFAVALVVMAFDGVVVACLNVAMNAQGAALEVRHGRNAMARLHATFSGGSLVAALVASAVTSVTEDLWVHFGIALVVVLALLALARPALLTSDIEPEEKPRRGRFALPAAATLWLGAAMVFGTITEGAMNDWSALYLEDIAQAPASLAPLGIAVVSAMMLVARLFADGWRTRFGDGAVVRVGATLAGIGLAAALLIGGVVPALIGFACVGLGIAAVTPCVYVAAARQGSDALTLVAAMGVTGLLGGPPIIGFVAGAGNLAWGMAVVAVSALVVAVCALRIHWPTRAVAPVE
ncbi:MFS transporter [Actinokineospora diospyrosa]|uniref:Fucose permease n=1 Tax=Actinokineospora diospyrosa TaxID=103728 RepID=A0ABT1IBS3_9PSEU|nr:MFS transporter [Actinokineospora diospyrosa]MCP2270087.1 Fucose permease [Actinokineospora diospyrosa]